MTDHMTPLERLQNYEQAAHMATDHELVCLPTGWLRVVKVSAPDVPYRDSRFVYQYEPELHGNYELIPREVATGLVAWKWSLPQEDI